MESIKDKQVGHASMKVNQGAPAGDIYISWWPKAENGKKGVLSGSPLLSEYRTWDDDCDSEGRKPDYCFDFSLSDTTIKAFWADFKTSNKYELYSTNCCRVIANALGAGGAETILPMEGYLTTIFREFRPVLTPSDLLRYCVAWALEYKRLAGKDPTLLSSAVSPDFVKSVFKKY
jgi:hypothetical protein